MCECQTFRVCRSEFFKFCVVHGRLGILIKKENIDLYTLGSG